jgi:hypothetical protein
MIRSIILLILLSNVCRAQEIIQWNENFKLTWEHFKGAPTDTTFAAMTYCGMEASVCKRNVWTGEISIEVRTTFYPDSSWYIPRKIHDLTLGHEQGHFDIAGWYARKLRKEIKETIRTVTNYNFKFANLFNTNYEAYLHEQNQYEKETACGTIKERQTHWEKLIKSKLEELEDFKTNPCQ